MIWRMPLPVISSSEPLRAKQGGEEIHADPDRHHECNHIFHKSSEPFAGFDKRPTDQKEENGQGQKQKICHRIHLSIRRRATLCPFRARARASFSSALVKRCFLVPTSTVDSDFRT